MSVSTITLGFSAALAPAQFRLTAARLAHKSERKKRVVTRMGHPIKWANPLNGSFDLKWSGSTMIGQYYGDFFL
jgi:hypothetical protein